MRNRTWIVIVAVALIGLLPRELAAQRRAEDMTVSALTVTVPSIIRVAVDPSAQSADGGPVVRVTTNDPALRAALAAGETLSPAMASVRTGNEPLSHHAKGADAPEAGADAPRVVVFTIAAP